VKRIKEADSQEIEVVVGASKAQIIFNHFNT
jgi:hypothetical protein